MRLIIYLRKFFVYELRLCEVRANMIFALILAIDLHVIRHGVHVIGDGAHVISNGAHVISNGEHVISNGAHVLNG